MPDWTGDTDKHVAGALHAILLQPGMLLSRCIVPPPPQRVARPLLLNIPRAGAQAVAGTGRGRTAGPLGAPGAQGRVTDTESYRNLQESYRSYRTVQHYYRT